MKWKRIAIVSIVMWLTIGIAFLFWRSNLNQKRLRHALNLEQLPRSLKIVAAADDIWTDYIVIFSCKIDPKEVDALLSGWSYEDAGMSSSGYRPEKISSKDSDYAGNLPDIVAHRKFEWRADDNSASCTVYIGKEGRKVRVEYDAE